MRGEAEESREVLFSVSPPTCLGMTVPGEYTVLSQKDFRSKTGRSRKSSEDFFTQEYVLRGRAGTQVSSCPRFLWQAGYVGHTNEGAGHSWRKEKFGGLVP